MAPRPGAAGGRAGEEDSQGEGRGAFVPPARRSGCRGIRAAGEGGEPYGAPRWRIRKRGDHRDGRRRRFAPRLLRAGRPRAQPASAQLDLRGVPLDLLIGTSRGRAEVGGRAPLQIRLLVERQAGPCKEQRAHLPVAALRGHVQRALPLLCRGGHLQRRAVCFPLALEKPRDCPLHTTGVMAYVSAETVAVFLRSLE